MAKTEDETRTGLCSTHGEVEGIRRVPRLRFPVLYFGLARTLARRKPFTCPRCGAPVTTC